jgi:outer membrane receptor protein involved in Fe transport
VQPEEATTLTAGFVYQPATGNDVLDGFSTSIDWFSIEIDGMIAVESDASVYNACLSPASNATGDIQHPACARILRNPTSGATQTVDVTYTNTGFSHIRGVDVALNWQGDLNSLGVDLPGSVGINFMVNALLGFETQASTTEPVIDWKGTLGPSPETSLNGGAYDYRTFTTFNYGLDNMNFSLRWRHLPEADPVQSVFARGNVIPEQGAKDTYDIFDFSASWDINDTYQTRLGIDNLFDTDPVITGAQISVAGSRPTSGMGTTMPGFYDVLGRRFYLGFKASY